MRNGHFNENWSTPECPVEGGISCGRGFTICWQKGPLGRGNERKEPNWAFVEDVIDAVVRRIEAYQATKFACDENAEALEHLRAALEVLDVRTKRREAQNIEGTHTADPPKYDIEGQSSQRILKDYPAIGIYDGVFFIKERDK